MKTQNGLVRDPDGKPVPRRNFLRVGAAGTVGMLAADDRLLAQETDPVRPDYGGPDVIIVRFGGGVRRRETIDPEHTHAPFLCRELTRRGTLFKDMRIDGTMGRGTSHGQGTLQILTGSYEFQNAGKFLEEKFEAARPTLFEYVRQAYRVPEHQTLIVNGEDRTQEEFYSFSNHHLFGATFRSEVLSLYRFKIHLLRKQIREGRWEGKELQARRKELRKMESLDYRTGGRRQSSAVEAFWDRWEDYYGRSGFVNPRGDRLLTELALWSRKYLRPKLMMINYNDPDYVHWGNLGHYTRGVAIIDQGLRQLVEAVEADERSRGNTVFVVVPDCGRDSNPFLAVPCQHHFDSKSSREIWALLLGPGIERGAVVDRAVDQSAIAATIGRIMAMPTRHAESAVLEEAFA